MKQNLDVRNLYVTRSSLQYNENNPGAQTYTPIYKCQHADKRKIRNSPSPISAITFFIINFIEEKPL